MLALSSILVFLTTFLAAGLAVLLGWFALERMGAEVLAEDVSEHLLDENRRLLRSETLSTIALWDKLLQRWDFTLIMRNHLLQADLPWSVGRITLLMLLSGAVALGLGAHLSWMPGWAMLLIAMLVAWLPYGWVLRRRARRFRRFTDSFPDALDSLARSLRAGHPFAAAMEIAAEESESPVSIELRRTAMEGSLGTSWDEALNGLAERVPVLEVSLFSAAVQLQNRTGGKLNEVLGKLAENMRESVALRGEVRALAAHGKLSGAVLTAMPLVITGLMLYVNPAYLALLANHPYGKYLITAAVICLVLGHLVIRRLVDIEL